MYDEIIEVTGEDGSRIVCTIDSPSPGESRGTVVLTPVFGATAHSMFIFAHALTTNGFRVVRMDFRDHVGLSDGEIIKATMTKQVEDIETVLRRFDDAILVSMSLSARAAFRALNRGSRVRSAVFVTPVVDTAYTLAAALDADYLNMDYDDIAPTVEVFSHDVERYFVKNCHEAEFVTTADTIKDLASVTTPMSFVVGDADPWVLPEHISETIQALGWGHDRLAVIEAASHKLNRNPVVVRRYITALLGRIFAHEGIDAEPDIPSFDASLTLMNACRERRRELIAGLTTRKETPDAVLH